MEFFESCLLQERGLVFEVKTSKHNFQIFTANSNQNFLQLCVPAFDTVTYKIIEAPEAAFLKAFIEVTIHIVVDSCDL